ncbi:MAG TPA: hypothetical protein PK593_08790 [Thermomicrobiales bacterium]|nr:hypothetical protein [Thermomicrobiales bacterium]
MPPTIFRALGATLLLAVPALNERLGDIALALTLVALAALFAVGAYAVHRSEAQVSWPITAIDTISMLTVVPTALVAASLVIADPRIGGGWGPALAAATAPICAMVVALLFAALLTSMAEAPAVSAALAFLPGPLAVTAVVLGAGRFGAQQASIGLSLALMISALATLSDGMLDDALRPLNPIAWYVVFVGGIAVIARGAGSTTVMASANMIALLTTIVAGGLLVATPALTMRIDRQRRKRIRPDAG